jgi:hypothetical protein
MRGKLSVHKGFKFLSVRRVGICLDQDWLVPFADRIAAYPTCE